MKLKEFWTRMLRKLTAFEAAEREYEEARVDLLEALTDLDHAQAVVEYQQARVRRLDKYLSSVEEIK